MKKINPWLLMLIIIILIIVFTPIFGFFYKELAGTASSFFWGPSHLEYFDGFFIAYSFFIPLLLTIFGGKRKYVFFIILIILELLVFLGYWQGFTIDAITAMVGWLLGEGILRIYKSVKK
ncbi:MAG: hypothetical protein WC244_03855 [Patescibacteria group bacterium]|jgi:hypothetical protein